MAIRYPELIGGQGNDAFNANNYVAMFGLQGADDFGGASSLQIGGSGNDYYYASLPAIVTVMERSGQGDVLYATGIGLARETTRAITLDQRHLFLFDTASAQGVVLLDWQQPATRIDTWMLVGGTYSYDQFIAAVSGFPRFEGNFTWEGAAAAHYFTLGPGETTAAINESLEFYKARSIALEQPVFTVHNNNTGAGSAFAGIPYSGPVSRLDLQFVATEAGEVIGGTAFSDFINAAGGTDAIDGGLGDDVIDGGLGSNFLTGGAGADIFFLDGRGGGITWSTITDWQAGEQLTIWGWVPGLSLSAWAASGGTAGFTGATLHCDLNADGTIDTSVTWAGRSQAELPTPVALDGLLWFA